jgi:hypothetical protein
LLAYLGDGGSLFKNRRRSRERSKGSIDGSRVDLYSGEEIGEQGLYTAFLTLLLYNRASKGQATEGEDGEVGETHFGVVYEVFFELGRDVKEAGGEICTGRY